MGILFNGSETIEAGLCHRFDDGFYIHDPIPKGRKEMHEAIDVAQVQVQSHHGASWMRSAAIFSTASRLRGAGCNFACPHRAIVLVR